MSLINMKTLMTALLLFLVIAQCNIAPAQVRSMRLWAPVRSDQFGGDARLREGMWGEVSYNYWMITKGKNRAIGWVDPSGKQSTSFNGSAFIPRINNMSTSSLANDFSGGTTISIGNIHKHHGWELKTTIMQAQRDSYQGTHGSMDIRDLATLQVLPMDAHDSWFHAIGMNGTFNILTPGGPGSQSYINGGFLWGWFLLGGGAVGLPGTDTGYGLAPLPITFDRFKIDSKVSHWDVEANYIFRAHATRIGFFEFTGGVRYMQLDDTLGFTGWGLPWRGDVLISIVDPTPSYGSGGGGGGTTDEVDVTEFYLQQGVLPGTNRDYAYSGTIVGPGTVLADSKWSFKAENHIVGPQAGIRYIKKCAGRWSLIADTKFLAGFNTQNLKSEGIMGSRTAGYNPQELSVVGSTGSDDILQGTGKIPWVPVGIMQNGREFRHTKTNTEFSPIIDFGLKAKWQFTDAIAFDIGYQGMYMDKTARASLVNSYEIDANGNIFGINDDVNQATWVQGVNFGISINRH